MAIEMADFIDGNCMSNHRRIQQSPLPDEENTVAPLPDEQGSVVVPDPVVTSGNVEVPADEGSVVVPDRVVTSRGVEVPVDERSVEAPIPAKEGNVVNAVTREEVHLIIDPLFGPGRPALADSVPNPSAAPGLQTIRLSEGPGYLSLGKDGNPLITKEPPSANVLLVEAIHDGTHPRVLLLCPTGGPRVVVNGQSAPRIAMLRVGDQLLLSDACLLHVSVFNRSRVGPPAEQQIGLTCPVCRTPITHDDEVYTCTGGCVLHHVSAPKEPAGTVVECAKVASECPGCTRPIVLKEGYVHEPDFG